MIPGGFIKSHQISGLKHIVNLFHEKILLGFIGFDILFFHASAKPELHLVQCEVLSFFYEEIGCLEDAAVMLCILSHKFIELFKIGIVPLLIKI